MDIPLFRAQFPEFSDTAKYPSAMVEFYTYLATLQVLPAVWKNATSSGINLYVAHELSVAGKMNKGGASSGGPASSKTVGSVSVSYDTTSSAEKDAGYWNLSSYGKQFYRLARIFGAGCVQL